MSPEFDWLAVAWSPSSNKIAFSLEVEGAGSVALVTQVKVRNQWGIKREGMLQTFDPRSHWCKEWGEG